MKISAMNWFQVEKYLASDDRAVVPLGSTEQHAFLSLSTDSILSERVAVDAAQPLGVSVFPLLAYGITPHFMDYPGTISLKTETYQSILCDILDSLRSTGFRRILLVNGHGGNIPGLLAVNPWLASNPDCRVRVHNWWNAPRTLAASTRTSLTRLIEEGLALRLRAERSPASHRARPSLPVYAGRGGLQPSIRNALSQRALLDAADVGD